MAMGPPLTDHGDVRDRPELASVMARGSRAIAGMSRLSLYMATGMPSWAAYYACGLRAAAQKTESQQL